MAGSLEFAHVFLFRCPECGKPLASACASTQGNLEMADAHLFDPHCHCGWSAPLIGLTSVKHCVEPWESPSLVAKESDSCDGKIDRSSAAA
jgi:hypothetical protein